MLTDPLTSKGKKTNFFIPESNTLTFYALT